jgi:3alpha(or 20beta)-hydroxysteroid dehydrogenase
MSGAFAPDALAGRTVLVTGAAQGLGAAAAEACLAAGARVVLTDLQEDVVKETAAGLGGGATALAHDVSDPDSWDAVVDAVRREHGELDGLVNNAGIFAPLSFADGTLAEFRRAVDVNMVGTFLGIQAFLRLRRGPGGSIVNLASVRGIVSGDRMASYTASKFGVRGLTKAAAVELGPIGVRVNAVCPGTIETPMAAAATADVDRELYLSLIPLRAAGRPRDIGGAVCWLLSDASAYVSGIDLPVDGGILATGNTPRPRRQDGQGATS